MSGNLNFPGVPEVGTNDVEHRRKIARALNGALQGKLNSTKAFTLTANAASSTVTDARLTANSFIGFMPTTANASAEIGAGTIYIGTRNNGTAIVTHANNAQSDRTYQLLIIG